MLGKETLLKTENSHIPENSLFRLRVFSVDDFTPFRPKMVGSRPGAVGKFKNDDQDYLLKIEYGGYANKVVGNRSESSCVESLMAQLIRAIWGSSYAADIHLAEINNNIPKVFKNGNLTEVPKNLLTSKYCVASVWINNSSSSKKFFDQNLLSTRFTELQTIGKLLGISDLKLENIVYDNGSEELFLVDCAGKFSCWDTNFFNPSYSMLDLTNRFSEQKAVEIAEKFVKFQDLKLIIDQYKMLSKQTVEIITNNFQEGQNKCKKFLEQYYLQKKSSSVTLFFNNKKNEKDIYSSEDFSIDNISTIFS